jgi:hypothetical protein
MISIHLQTRALDGLLQTAGKLGRGADAALAGARAAASLTRRHLLALDISAPNRLGGPRTHFYAAAAQSVQEPAQEDGGASFTITKTGLAQRRFGGPIEAGKGTSSVTRRLTQYLSIPARAEAHGKVPGDFDNLVFIPNRYGGGRLVEKLRTSTLLISRGNRSNPSTNTADGLVMFWLVTGVHQEPDPKVLPDEAVLAGVALEGADNYLSQLLQTRREN